MDELELLDVDQQVNEDTQPAPKLPDLAPKFGEPFGLDPAFTAFVDSANNRRDKWLSGILNNVDGIDVPKTALDPKGLRETAASMAVIHQMTGMDPTEIAKNHPLYRKGIASGWGEPTPKTDGEFVQMAKKHITGKLERQEAVQELYGGVIKKVLDDTNNGQDHGELDLPTQFVQEWATKNAGKLRSDDPETNYHSLANNLYFQARKDLQSVKEPAAEVLKTLTGFTQGKVDDDAMEATAQHLVDATPEQRQTIYKYVAIAADAGQIDRKKLEQFAINMGQSFTRGFDFLNQATLKDQEDMVDLKINSINSGDVHMKEGVENPVAGQYIGEPGTREMTPDEKSKWIEKYQKLLPVFQVVRELRNTAKNSVDPIIPITSNTGVAGSIERGAYGLAGSIPLMAVSFNPILGARAYQAQEYDRIMLENPNIDRNFASSLALLEGAGEAALDKLQLRAISGKLPVFGGLLNGIKSNGIRRVLTTVGAEILEQNIQEAAQDLIPPLAETMSAALRKDMPDKDFGAMMGDYIGSRADTFFAVLPLALIGGGVATVRDLKNPSLQLSDKMLQIAGFSPSQRDYIHAAESPEERTQRIQEEWSKRKEEDINAGKEMIQQSYKEASESSGDKLEVSKDQEGNDQWTVRDADGNEVATVKSQDEANTIIKDRQAARLESDRNVVNDMINHWLGQDPNNEVQRVKSTRVSEELDRLSQLDTEESKARITQIWAGLREMGIKEGDDLSNLHIMGSSTVEEVAKGVFKGTIAIMDNATPLTVFEEVNHDFVEKALLRGTVQLSDLQKWVQQTNAATGSTHLFSDKYETKEAIAKIALDYAAGRIQETALPNSFIGYIRGLLKVVKEAFLRAANLKKAISEGKIDSDFENFLAASVGLAGQDIVDRVRDATSEEISNKDNTSYSIGEGEELDNAPEEPGEFDEPEQQEVEQEDVPESVDEGATLENVTKLATSKVWEKGRDLKAAIQEKLQELAKKAGVDVSVPGPQSFKYLVRVGLKDAIAALKQNANAIGWYDLKTRQALKVMSLIHPEILTDENARFAFTWALAVTSNGMKVDSNFELAEKAYDFYKKNGTMPTDLKAGQAQKAINQSLELFNELRDKWGMDNLRQFMQTNFTVKEISSINKDLKPGGEFADTTVRGASIIGPKIGNGFFSNLYGNFTSLTMDRWLIRTWGRWTGTLLKIQPKHIENASSRLSSAINAISKEQAAKVSEIVGKDILTTDPHELAMAIQKASMDPELRKQLNETPQTEEIRKSGNGLAKYLDGQKEAPSGPAERVYIRSVFQSVLDELRKSPEYKDLTMADLQAVLWYAEKRLYETAKEDPVDEDETEGYADDEAPDYANAAANVARSKGISERKIANALKQEEQNGRTTGTRPADENPNQPRGEQGASGGFTEKEKRNFIFSTAARTVRSNRKRNAEPSWSYTGGSHRNDGGVWGLKKPGVTADRLYKAGSAFKRVYRANGLTAPDYYRLSKSLSDKDVKALIKKGLTEKKVQKLQDAAQENARKFAAILEQSKVGNKFGAAVYVYSAEDYAGMDLYMDKDGQTGFAIKPDGDIVSVFSMSKANGAIHALMEAAVAMGGKKLDCFDTILPELYDSHGFKAASRLAWDDSQAPEGWSKETFGKYNNGEPDVVFMVLDSSYMGMYSINDGKKAASYDQALNIQKRAISAVAKDNTSFSILDQYAGQESVQVTKKGRHYSPILRDILQRRKNGENISFEDIQEAVRTHFPARMVSVPKSMKDLPSVDQVKKAIGKKYADNPPTPGTKVTQRQDVPSQTDHGIGVVTIQGDNGVSYRAAGMILNPVFATNPSNERMSLKIAMGEDKGPHITIKGEWAEDQSMPDDLENWTQVGFNPDRHSYYYDRSNDSLRVTGGSKAYQIGNTVFVKDATYGDPNQSSLSYSIVDGQRDPETEQKISTLLEQYDSGEGVEDFGDLVDQLNELAGESGHFDLDQALRDYQDAVRQDYRDYGGRGDADEYEAQLIANLENIVAGKPLNPPNEGTSFSIQSQEQIDSLAAAAMQSMIFPESRIALYERAKNRLRQVLQDNKGILDSMQAHGASREKIRFEKLHQAIGELDGILKVLPAEVRGKVGGFATLSNVGTGNKALADFFSNRIRMIDQALEKHLRQEYTVEIGRVFDRAKPKKANPGEKPKGIGADIQEMFAKMQQAMTWTADELNQHLAGIDSRLDAGGLSALDEAKLTREADLMGLVGNWHNADSNRMASAVETLKETWAKGYFEFIFQKILEKEQRELDRQQAISHTGTEGTLRERQDAQKKEQGLLGKFKKGYFNLISWDHFVSVLFGENSEIAKRFSNGERIASNQKEDAIQAKMDDLSDLFTTMAGGDRLKGEQLRWKMSQKEIKPFMGTPWSGLEFSQLEALSATMLWMQEDGRRHMIGKLDDSGNPTGSWHYTQEFVDALEDSLSPEAKQIRDYLLKQYATEYKSINRVYKALNGINLPQINNYSPVTVAPITAPAGSAIDPVTGGVISGGGSSPGALRTRGSSISEPNFRDVLQTYIAHTKMMEHWKAYAPFMAELNGILRNRDVQNAIQAKGGDEAKSTLNTWLDIMSQGGVRSAEAQLGLAKEISALGGRAARVALVGRLGTIMVQATQLGAGLAEMPTGAYILRFSKLLSGNLGWGKAFQSAYIQRRMNEMPPIVRQAVEGLSSSKPNVVKATVEKLGSLISGADAIFTAGTYAIVYDYHLGQAKKMGLLPADAEAYATGVAERATDKLAQPTRMGARSVTENVSTGLVRNFWAFASESRKNLGLAAFALASKDPARIARTLFSLVVLNSLFGNIIRNAWKDARDDDDDEWFDEKHWGLSRLAVSTMVDALQVRGIPVLGDAISSGIYDSFGQYNQTGGLISEHNAIKAIQHIPKYAAGQADWEMTFKDIDGVLSGMGLFNDNIASAASLTHLASDLFGVAKNTKKEVEK